MSTKKTSKYKFTLTEKDKSLLEFINQADHKTLATWAFDCTERVMHFFEDGYPYDKRPGIALNALMEWINTGKFNMSIIRKSSLDSHAAAREIGKDNSARSAARAAGQAVATAHVSMHCIGAVNYALQAVYRDYKSLDAEDMVKKEREWQYKHLLELINMK